MVRGRYLATFSSNCFGIIRKLVAAKVAAAILVATSRPQVIHEYADNRLHIRPKKIRGGIRYSARTRDIIDEKSVRMRPADENASR